MESERVISQCDTTISESGMTVSEVYIRFNGLMRDSESLPIKFNEVWTLQKTNNSNQGWLLAGIFQDEQLD